MWFLGPHTSGTASKLFWITNVFIKRKCHAESQCTQLARETLYGETQEEQKTRRAFALPICDAGGRHTEPRTLQASTASQSVTVYCEQGYELLRTEVHTSDPPPSNTVSLKWCVEFWVSSCFHWSLFFMMQNRMIASSKSFPNCWLWISPKHLLLHPWIKWLPSSLSLAYDVNC